MCIISKLKSTGGAADKKKIMKKQNWLGCKFSQLPNHIKSIFHHFQSLCPQWNGVFFLYPASSNICNNWLWNRRENILVFGRGMTLLMAKSVPVKERNWQVCDRVLVTLTALLFTVSETVTVQHNAHCCGPPGAPVAPAGGVRIPRSTCFGGCPCSHLQADCRRNTVVPREGT